MSELKPEIYDENNGLDYVLIGDYYFPDLRLPEDDRPAGKWGQMHREYLRQNRPLLFSELVLSGRLFTYLADLNKQAAERLEVIISQMQEAEGVTENLKRQNQMEWVRRMNSIRSRAEEIILQELIHV